MALQSLSPEQASAVVQRDVGCMQCEYNLRGLLAGGRCPECGTPVARSLPLGELYVSSAVQPRAQRVVMLSLMQNVLSLHVLLWFILPFSGLQIESLYVLSTVALVLNSLIDVIRHYDIDWLAEHWVELDRPAVWPMVLTVLGRLAFALSILGIVFDPFSQPILVLFIPGLLLIMVGCFHWRGVFGALQRIREGCVRGWVSGKLELLGVIEQGIAIFVIGLAFLVALMATAPNGPVIGFACCALLPMLAVPIVWIVETVTLGRLMGEIVRWKPPT